MEITWYGQACFRIRDGGRSVVTDPYSPEVGLKLPRLSTSVVTISHDHADHNCVKGLRGSPYVISGPGEYEVGGIFFFGVPTFHDDRGGQERDKNTAYVIEFGDLTVCHLGDLGHVPSQEQIEQLAGADILLIPVGGRGTLAGGKAAEVVSILEPAIVIPMHYKVPGLVARIETAARFLREMGVEKSEPLETLKIAKSQLPEQTRVTLLAPRQ